MTRDKLVRIIALGLSKTEGKTNLQRAAKCADLFEAALELEAVDQVPDGIEVGEVGQIGQASRNQLRSSQTAPIPPRMEASRYDPADLENQQGSMIILPDSKEGIESLKSVEPTKLSRNRKQSTAYLRKYWTIEDLRQHVDDNTPSSIEILPKGRKNTLTLSKNVVVGPGFDAVKLIYYIDGSNPTSSGVDAGDAMILQLTAEMNFWTTEEYPNVPQKLEELKANAVDIFRVHPKEIVSSNPMIPGELNVGPAVYRQSAATAEAGDQTIPFDMTGRTGVGHLKHPPLKR